MAIECQADVLESIMSLLNENVLKNSTYKLKFSSLEVTSDSLCLAYPQSVSNPEQASDCTGSWVSCTMRLVLIRRVMQTDSFDDESVVFNQLKELLGYLKLHYKELADENFYIDSVSELSSPHIDTVYSGGAKDYSSEFSIYYERKVI